MILPAAGPGFAWTETDSGPALVCAPLREAAPHLFSTRSWPLGSRDLSSDGPAWEAVARAIALEPARLVRVRQVHGAGVAIARAGLAPLPTADIVVAGEEALGAAVQSADCVPLLIADRRTGCVAAAHAGWRGLASRVPATAVQALVRELGSRTADLMAAIGPSIGACCYEVGEDVRARFLEAAFSSGDLARWFHEAPVRSASNPPMPGLSPKGDGRHWFFDAGMAAADALAVAGVPGGQIFSCGLCTASHPSVFCSYRRDGVSAGRMAAAIRCRGTSPWPGSRADRRWH